MLDLPVSRDFQQVEMADQVGAHIGMRVLNRIAHPRLRAEMDDAVEVSAGERGGEARHVGEILVVKGEAIAAGFAKAGKARLLQANIVIGVEIVDADDLIAPRQELAGKTVTDKPGRAGDENAHFDHLTRPRKGGNWKLHKVRPCEHE